jgi:hypothetical protein
LADHRHRNSPPALSPCRLALAFVAAAVFPPFPAPFVAAWMWAVRIPLPRPLAQWLDWIFVSMSSSTSMASLLLLTWMVQVSP